MLVANMRRAETYSGWGEATVPSMPPCTDVLTSCSADLASQML